MNVTEFMIAPDVGGSYSASEILASYCSQLHEYVYATILLFFLAMIYNDIIYEAVDSMTQNRIITAINRAFKKWTMETAWILTIVATYFVMVEYDGEWFHRWVWRGIVVGVIFLIIRFVRNKEWNWYNEHVRGWFKNWIGLLKKTKKYMNDTDEDDD